MQERYKVIFSEVKKGKILKEEEFQAFMKRYEILDLKIYHEKFYVIFKILYQEKRDELQKTLMQINQDLVLTIRECWLSGSNGVHIIDFCGSISDYIHKFTSISDDEQLINELKYYVSVLEMELLENEKYLDSKILKRYNAQINLIDDLLAKRKRPRTEFN